LETTGQQDNTGKLSIVHWKYAISMHSDDYWKVSLRLFRNEVWNKMPFYCLSHGATHPVLALAWIASFCPTQRITGSFFGTWVGACSLQKI
jgi:hypothetical protein